MTCLQMLKWKILRSILTWCPQRKADSPCQIDILFNIPSTSVTKHCRIAVFTLSDQQKTFLPVASEVYSKRNWKAEGNPFKHNWKEMGFPWVNLMLFWTNLDVKRKTCWLFFFFSQMRHCYYGLSSDAFETSLSNICSPLTWISSCKCLTWKVC